MPIDPSIPLSGQAPKFNDPFAVLGQMRQQAEQSRLARENADSLRDERLAVAEQHRQQTAAVAQAQAESDALSHLFGSGQPVNPPDIYKIVGPTRGAAILKGMLDVQTAQFKNEDDIRASMLRRISGIKALPEDMRAGAYGMVVNDYVTKGVVKPDEVPPYSPQVLDQYEQQLLSPDKRYDAQHPKPVSVAAGSTLVDPVTNQPVYTAPAKEDKPAAAKEYEYAVAQGYKGTFSQYQNEDANRRRSITNVNGANPADDVKEAVKGMIDGTIPPQLPGRASKEYTLTMAEAHRQGYNLAAAVTDWNATQKHIASMNGAQQLRLTQSINALPDLLDSVDALAAKWKGGRFPILNKANLALAKGGTYGPEVASIANQLDAQVADVTSDLGSVYMGGNSPTDHALGLAAKSLQGDWSEKVFHDMVALAKQNVKIRKNSITSTGVSGASAQNPYDHSTNIENTGGPAGPPPPKVQRVYYDLNGNQVKR